MKTNRAFAPDWQPRHTRVFAMMTALYKGYLRLGRSRVTGRRNVPQSGPVILAPNHVSNLDPPITGVSCGRWPYTMAKAELFQGAFGWVIEQMGTFPVHRGEADRRALKLARQLLKQGEAIIIFPEGTRSPDGQLQTPEIGVAMLAHQSRAAIVPIFLGGTDQTMSALHPKFKIVRTEIRIGKPLELDDLYARRANRETLEEIGRRWKNAVAELGKSYRDVRG